MDPRRRTPTAVPPDEGAARRSVVVGLFLLILAGCVVGAVAYGPYFVMESQRLSLSQIILFWVGDAVALFWFAVYLVRHVVFRAPIAAPSGSNLRTVLLTSVATVSILSGIGLDLWMSLSLRQSELDAFDGAVRVVGSIDSLEKFAFPKRDAYKLECSFTDAQQVVHAPTYHLRDPDELPSLAPDVVQAVRGGQLPAPVSIAYQADRPARNWLADMGGRDKTRMHGFSLCVLLFQGMGCLTFIFLLVLSRFTTGALPWWYDLHGVFLVAVEAAFLLLFGTLTLAAPRPVFWGDF
jgi:hypothetical protein